MVRHHTKSPLPYTRAMRTIAILLTAILLACAPAKPQVDAVQIDAPESGEIVRVHVTADGKIRIDGKPASIDDVAREAKRLAASGGAVHYTRDNPKADPHPNATKVIQVLNDSHVRTYMELN